MAAYSPSSFACCSMVSAAGASRISPRIRRRVRTNRVILELHQDENHQREEGDGRNFTHRRGALLGTLVRLVGFAIGRLLLRADPLVILALNGVSPAAELSLRPLAIL